MKNDFIYYTVPEHADTLLISIKARKDGPKAREKAIAEILQKMEDENDLSLNSYSFQNGLDVSKLVVVPSPHKKKGNQAAQSATQMDTISPIEEAAINLAKFSLFRVNLQEQQQLALTYLALIEALFSEKPLDEEQVKTAKSKEFVRSIKKLATAKVEYDHFRPRAVSAWEVLKPVITAGKRPEDL